jgi:hypothetical protein
MRHIPAPGSAQAGGTLYGLAFNGKEFEKVFCSGTVTEAESKSQAWGTWAEICEGSPKLARLGLADREEWAGSGEYVPPKKMIIFSEKTSKSY